VTNRERTLNILNYKACDRLPAVHFGYWRELLDEWVLQGHITRELKEAHCDCNEADFELDKRLGWDYEWAPVFGGKNSLSPPFEYKVLEKLPGGFLRVQNPDGLIERVKEGVHGIPAEDDYQLKDRDAYEKLYKWRIQWSEDRLDVDAFTARYKSFDADMPRGFSIGSCLGSIRNFLSVIGLSYMIFDDYGLLKEIVDTYAEMQYRVAEKALATGLEFDFAHYWEDICFKNGPLCSPEIVEELTAHNYRKMSALFKRHGVEIISLDCDGVIDSLVPIWLDNGINTMFPIEYGTWQASIASWRKKYGKGLKGVGGVNKNVFLRDKAAVDAEIERLKPLIALGGYLPCPDHRLMPGTKWELIQYYTDKIKNKI